MKLIMDCSVVIIYIRILIYKVLKVSTLEFQKSKNLVIYTSYLILCLFFWAWHDNPCNHSNLTHLDLGKGSWVKLPMDYISVLVGTRQLLFIQHLTYRSIPL